MSPPSSSPLVTTTLRPTIPSDIPILAQLDITANHHPITTVPWPSPAVALAVFEHRQSFFLSQPETYKFLTTIAQTSEGEEIIGFIIGARPRTGKEPEWEPDLPEGTNLAFMGYFLSKIAENKSKVYESNPGMWELESLSVSSEWQRKGVGAMLVTTWLEDVDAVGGKAYVSGSAMGRGLYEKFGWRVVQSVEFDLEQFGKDVVGDRKSYTSWNMIRDGRQVRVN